MDVLSDVLRVVRLSGAVFFNGEFSAPWALDEPNPDELAALGVPITDCMVLFHILAEGSCVFECDGLPPVQLASGDVIIFPHADAHRMASEQGLRSTKPASPPQSESATELPQMAIDGGGRTSRFICGYLECDQKFNPLLGALPTILVVRSRDEYLAVEAIDRNGKRPTQVPPGIGTWLSTTLKFIVHEARVGRPGNAAMLGRLTELMFLEILRQYMQQLPSGQSGWLAGLNDPQVGKALRLMHAQPARNWTVEELAREAAVSRSALAERFTEMIGDPPMKYLAGWRIQLAQQMLREGRHSIAQVAERVGYDSEAAFNRAFKRAVGVPPAAWRKQAAARACPPPPPQESAATAG